MIVTGLLGPGPGPVMNTPGTVDLGIDSPRATEEDFAALESVCGMCGEELIYQDGVMRCSVCGTRHFPAQVNKAESQYDDFGFQPSTIAQPVF